jgi:phosphoglycolate phosphatase
MKTAFNTLIFDFDYTLADSSHGVVSCVNFALESLGFSSTTYEKSCQTIGLSLQETYAYLTNQPAAQGQKFARLFVEQAERVMTDRTVLFADTPTAIKTLKHQGYLLGIVSTKYRYRIEEILTRDGLLAPFDHIVGGEDVTNYKPDPESLILAIEKLNVAPQDAIYVGDSVVDALTAANVGLSFYAVLSGVTPRAAFSATPVERFFDTVGELAAWIAG